MNVTFLGCPALVCFFGCDRTFGVNFRRFTERIVNVWRDSVNVRREFSMFRSHIKSVECDIVNARRDSVNVWRDSVNVAREFSMFRSHIKSVDRDIKSVTIKFSVVTEHIACGTGAIGVGGSDNG
jgi:hypothetical protein